jgi:hypothetical protein
VKRNRCKALDGVTCLLLFLVFGLMIGHASSMCNDCEPQQKVLLVYCGQNGSQQAQMIIDQARRLCFAGTSTRLFRDVKDLWQCAKGAYDGSRLVGIVGAWLSGDISTDELDNLEIDFLNSNVFTSDTISRCFLRIVVPEGQQSTPLVTLSVYSRIRKLSPRDTNEVSVASDAIHRTFLMYPSDSLVAKEQLMGVFPESNSPPVLNLQIRGATRDNTGQLVCTLQDSLSIDASLSYDQETPPENLRYRWSDISRTVGRQFPGAFSINTFSGKHTFVFSELGVHKYAVWTNDGTTSSSIETVAVRVEDRTVVTVSPAVVKIWRQGSLTQVDDYKVEIDTSFALAGDNGSIGQNQVHCLAMDAFQKGERIFATRILPDRGDTALIGLSGFVNPTKRGFQFYLGKDGLQKSKMAEVTLDCKLRPAFSWLFRIEGCTSSEMGPRESAYEDASNGHTVASGARLFVTERIAFEYTISVFHPFSRRSTPKHGIQLLYNFPWQYLSAGFTLNCRQLENKASDDRLRLGAGLLWGMWVSEPMRFEAGFEYYPKQPNANGKLIVKIQATYGIETF